MPAAINPGSGSAARITRYVFGSAIQATVTLTATAGDVSLPSVTIPANLIAGTIVRVLAGISWRKQEDTSTVDNAINVAQTIQVRSDAPGVFTNAIDIPDNALATKASATEGGTMILGDEDIKAEVDGPDTYEFQWNDADVDGNNLVLSDVQTFLFVEAEA